MLNVSTKSYEMYNFFMCKAIVHVTVVCLKELQVQLFVAKY